MNKAFIVILWTVLSATSVMAVQVCPAGIPQTTPSADFTENGDGTITHKQTGLMWKQCVEGLSGAGCTTGSVDSYTWQAALLLADGHNFAGYSDWRLPNIKELTSILELSCHSPAINLSVFPNDPGLYVWSASPLVSNSDLLWIGVFDHGGDSWAWRDDPYFQVRLVRGGQ